MMEKARRGAIPGRGSGEDTTLYRSGAAGMMPVTPEKRFGSRVGEQTEGGEACANEQ